MQLTSRLRLKCGRLTCIWLCLSIWKKKDYVIKRGGKAKVDKLDVVPNDFGTPLEVFEQVYKHECRVSEMIDKLVDVAAAEKDKATQDFLWGFVREQVEEEATAAGIVDMIKKAGATGIFFVDVKLGER